MLIKDLMNRFGQRGKIMWIGIRNARREPMTVLEEVNAIERRGLEGDRHKGAGGRQVTLIQYEHLPAVAAMIGQPRVLPGLVRRNLVVSGINLLALKGKSFQIGEAVLEYSGECHPCSRMEENLGFGGYNAMRGHGGITAKVIQGGKIRIGDSVLVVVAKTVAEGL
jgi:MOSC domain-containing protein YiiM